MPEPLKVAVLDIGTNSFHLIIGEMHPKKKFTVVDREKAVLRLASTNPAGELYITAEKITAAQKLIRQSQHLAFLYEAPLRVVATSAVREAINSAVFLSEIKKHTDVKIEVLSGQREAALIFRGIHSYLKNTPEKLFCFDIGGGSTEFISAENGEILHSLSVPLGAVRFSTQFFPDFVLTPERILACISHIDSVIEEAQIQRHCREGIRVVGSSGTTRTALAMIQKLFASKSKMIGTQSFARADLELLCSLTLSKKTIAERMQMTGIEEKRADILPAGLLILRAIIHAAGVNEIMYSDYALREGVLLDSIDMFTKNPGLLLS